MQTWVCPCGRNGNFNLETGKMIIPKCCIEKADFDGMRAYYNAQKLDLDVFVDSFRPSQDPRQNGSSSGSSSLTSSNLTLDWYQVNNPRTRAKRPGNRYKNDLDEYLAILKRVETAYDDKGKAIKHGGSISSSHDNVKKQVEKELLARAIANGDTCGKWMIMAKTENVDMIWREVTKMTYSGELNESSKVSTKSPGKDSHVICVYVHFDDVEEKKKVRNKLVRLTTLLNCGHLCNYKPDLYTELDIYSGDGSRYTMEPTIELTADELKEGEVAKADAKKELQELGKRKSDSISIAASVKLGGGYGRENGDTNDPELQEAIKMLNKEEERIEPSLKKIKTSRSSNVIDLYESSNNVSSVGTTITPAAATAAVTAAEADPLQKLGLSLQLSKSDPGVWRASIYDDAGNCATWNHLIALLGSTLGRSAFNYAISLIPFDSFTWETPVLCLDSATCMFEMAAFEMDKKLYEGLHRNTYEEIKSEKAVSDGAAKFPSGPKTMLISPADVGGGDRAQNVMACRHIGKFTKNASTEQQDAFWTIVGEELLVRSQADYPTWICTDGTEVHWLHLRLQKGGPRHINTEAYKRVPRGPSGTNASASIGVGGGTGSGNATVCRFWNGEDGSCRNGDRCRYQHI